MSSVKPLILLSLLVVAACWNSFPGAFHYDDYALMLENPRMIELSFQDVLFQFGGRPLTLWTFSLQQPSTDARPEIYHLVNVLLHLVIVLLLFLVIRRLSGDPFTGFVAAALFAVHPVQSFAFNYIWARSVLLLAFFGLLSGLAVRRFPILAIALFQLAVLSRADGLLLSIPLFLLLRSRRGFLVSLTAINLLLVLSGSYLFPAEDFLWSHPDWISYWLLIPAGFLTYLGYLIFPRELSIYHSLPSFSHLEFWLGLLAMAVLAGVAIVLYRRKQRIPAAGIGFFLLMVTGTLILPNGDLVSEGRIYLAMAGFSLAVAWGFRQLLDFMAGRFQGRGSRVFASLSAGLLLFALLQGTASRNEVWKDDLALWQEAVRLNPNDSFPLYNLATAQVRVGKLSAACTSFREVTRLNPRDDMGYAGLGFCAESHGELGNAMRFYEQALSLNPQNDYAARARSRLETFDPEEVMIP